MADLGSLADGVRVPAGGEKVYKDQCVYSFDTPKSEGGLYVCLQTFVGLGRDFVERHYKKTGSKLFLHIKAIKQDTEKVPPKVSVDEPPAEKKPTRLAIGVEGGFPLDQPLDSHVEHTTLVVLPEFREIPLPNAALPERINASIAGVMASQAACKQEAVQTWDGEKRLPSKHAEKLLQLENGKRIPPKGWKCEQCDLTKNLWLNLTDGSILCGRRYFDGSGGNNHAVDHYTAMKYPLAVKLGTITPSGADVYSYEEDEMVLDPLLGQHLQHWGINISQMEKTDATMTELEIDMNMRIGEWSVLQESDEKLSAAYGPGLTGMVNLGNSCYFNSVMQVLLTVEEFQQKYIQTAQDTFDKCNANPADDFNVQMSKLAVSVSSGKYSQAPPGCDAAVVKEEDSTQVQKEGISPYMLKGIVGRGHAEFSTQRQQDAYEYLLHLFDFIDKIEMKNKSDFNPTALFKFQLEERLQVANTKQVKYTNIEERVLRLPVPLEKASNYKEVVQWEEIRSEKEKKKEKIKPEEIVRGNIPFTACLEDFFGSTTVAGYAGLGAAGELIKSTKMASFPDYLFVQLNKFMLAEDWTPKKLDVLVDVPEQLDLTSFKGCGRQVGEEELSSPAEPKPDVKIDEGLVSALVDMGFNLEGCRKAVYHTKNQGLEAAMEWVLQHMGDDDFVAPLDLPKSGSHGNVEVNQEHVIMLEAMGFTREHSIRGLSKTGGSLERAADWLFSHISELDEPPEKPSYSDGSGLYELKAFISHMGTSPHCGHYVCHIKKDRQWVIFNDEKVCFSKKPPISMAYIYLFKRTV